VNGEIWTGGTATGADGAGAYTLGLQEGPPPIAAQPIAIGATVEGELTASDGKGESDTPADAFRFEGQEGQRIRIDMTSSDFDTYLELFDENRVSLDEDDDGGPEGTDSRLTITLPRTGAYIIEARAFSETTGDYSLSVTEVEPERAPDSIAFGSSLQGEIGESDPRDDDDRGYDAFTFSGREGQRIQAIMRSGDFDTFLQVGKAEGEFTALASDDDGLMEGTDSRLNFTLPEDGDYVLRASPLGSDSKGLYALELIDRGPQPQPGSILVGATAVGTPTGTDAPTDSNSHHSPYRPALRDERPAHGLRRQPWKHSAARIRPSRPQPATSRPTTPPPRRSPPPVARTLALPPARGQPPATGTRHPAAWLQDAQQNPAVTRATPRPPHHIREPGPQSDHG